MQLKNTRISPFSTVDNLQNICFKTISFVEDSAEFSKQIAYIFSNYNIIKKLKAISNKSFFEYKHVIVLVHKINKGILYLN